MIDVVKKRGTFQNDKSAKILEKILSKKLRMT